MCIVTIFANIYYIVFQVIIIKTPYKKTKAELKENIRTEMNEKITSYVFQIEVEFENEVCTY